MGIGTFVIAQHDEGLWMVYGTFEACGDKTKQLSCVTSITGQLVLITKVSNFVKYPPQ